METQREPENSAVVAALVESRLRGFLERRLDSRAAAKEILPAALRARLHWARAALKDQVELLAVTTDERHKHRANSPASRSGDPQEKIMTKPSVKMLTIDPLRLIAPARTRYRVDVVFRLLRSTTSAERS